MSSFLSLTSMQLVPFPRPFLKTYVIAALVTGLSIAFILIVFQPFGTDQFRHAYKFWILSGYGIIAACSIAAYYTLSLRLFNRGREHAWTIFHESSDFFASLIIGLLMCYFYFAYIFDNSITLAGMFQFLLRAGSVALLPSVGLFLYLLNQYRGVVRSTMQVVESSKVNHGGNVIVLKGANKEDLIKTSEDQILYIKSEDNYVILHLLENEGAVKRHMIRSTLKQILGQLDPLLFVLCHRSYIINRRRLIALSGNKNNTLAEISGSLKKVPISRSKVDALRASL